MVYHQAGKVKVKDFSPAELLTIMEELNACFVSDCFGLHHSNGVLH